jgi:hypothetical protein
MNRKVRPLAATCVEDVERKLHGVCVVFAFASVQIMDFVDHGEKYRKG